MPISNYLPSSRLYQSGVCTSTTRPNAPYEGQVIYETDTDKTLVWRGSFWANLSVPLPQITLLTSGSGTYTVPTGCQYLHVRMVGGGGGGAGSGGGSGAGNAGNGNAGTATAFGSSLLTANAGSGGASASNGGGAGGGGTINAPAVGIICAGVQGYNLGQYNTAQQVYTGGQGGPPTPLGSYGAGGAGAGTLGVAVCVGSSGGSGCYIDAVITSPSATYAYTVGAGGTGGTAGTSGFVGGAGGAGVIYVTAY